MPQIIKEIYSLNTLYIMVVVFSLFAIVKGIAKRIKLAYYSPLSKIPGPKLFFLSRMLMQLKRIGGKRWAWIQHHLHPTYGSVVRISPNDVLIADKEGIRQILVVKDFPKSFKSYHRFRRDLHTQTLLSITDKATYKNRRRMISPAFSIKYLSSLQPLIHTCVQELILKIDNLIKAGPQKDGVIINLVPLMSHTSLDIIGATAFGGPFGVLRIGQHPLLGKAVKEMRRRVTLSMLPFLKLFLPEDPFLLQFTKSLINKRRQQISPQKDILQILLNTADKDEAGLRDIDVHEQIVEFCFAGTDTTGYTMYMALINLIHNPEKLRKLTDELDAAIPLIDPNKLPVHSELQNLPYLNAVLNETMRLWPVILDGGMSRETDEDIVIGEYTIPKGTRLFANTFALHRSREEWGHDADEFKPERWLEPEKLPSGAFYPFSGGTRNCPGSNFALLEMRLILATLLRRYTLTDIPGQGFDVIQAVAPEINSGKYFARFWLRESY